MTILYALVARKKTVLAEYTTTNGNFPTVTRVLLSKIPEHDSRMSYVYDKHVFHYIVDQGITFLCMSDENTKRRITFAFLDDVKKVWRDRFSSVEQTALAFSLNDMFAPILKNKIVSSFNMHFLVRLYYHSHSYFLAVGWSLCRIFIIRILLQIILHVYKHKLMKSKMS